MQIEVENKLTELQADTLVVGVWCGGENGKPELTPSAVAVDKAGGLISAQIEAGDFKGKPSEVAVFYGVAGLDFKRVIVVGLGMKDAFSEKTFINVHRKVARFAKSGSVALTSAEWTLPERDEAWAARSAVRELLFASHKSRGLKTKGKGPQAVEKILWVSETDVASSLQVGCVSAGAMIWAKELQDLPPNICDPQFLAEAAESVVREFEKTAGKSAKGKLTVKVLDKDAIDEAGMGGVIGVSKGSQTDPVFIELAWQGADASKAPVVLVGKGVTFDAGGISLKPSRTMDQMKFDMSGAAVVMAAVKAAAEMELKENVVALVPAVENLPSGSALKPADVITTLSGLTVEVLNTDAEGRLILADALARAAELEPEVCIDVATLTGACIVALGTDVSGLFCEDEPLTAALACAADSAHDPVWPMPMGGTYKKALESSVADLANISWTAGAGACTAATFLAAFAPKCPWAHLDVAGTAQAASGKSGGTARPLPLILEWLLSRAPAPKANKVKTVKAKAAAKTKTAAAMVKKAAAKTVRKAAAK